MLYKHNPNKTKLRNNKNNSTYNIMICWNVRTGIRVILRPKCFRGIKVQGTTEKEIQKENIGIG